MPNVYAIDKHGRLMTAEYIPGQKYYSCPKCGRGVPLGHKCHGWHITKAKPAERRIRLSA